MYGIAFGKYVGAWILRIKRVRQVLMAYTLGMKIFKIVICHPAAHVGRMKWAKDTRLEMD
jgi:hypothetical protein